jgi:peptide/nickel transport system permease protein
MKTLRLKEGLRSTASFFMRSKAFRVGTVMLSLILLLALLEPAINGYILKGKGPLKTGVFDKYLPPSLEHPLGTDHYGRDVLALLLASLKYSLLIGVLAGLIATLIGTVTASLAGYFGGKVDLVLNGLTNGMLVIPSFPILIAIAAYTRLDLIAMSLILGIFSWAWSARVIRAQILSMKERPYIELAKVSGFNSFEIMFLEILPNMAPFIVMGLINSIMGAIFAETGLRVLGLGPGELPSLGLMISWALTFGAVAIGRYNLLVAPAGTLVLVFISLNLINIGLEEIFNPRLKKITGL